MSLRAGRAKVRLIAAFFEFLAGHAHKIFPGVGRRCMAVRAGNSVPLGLLFSQWQGPAPLSERYW